jgi:hypothetical protein
LRLRGFLFLTHAEALAEFVEAGDSRREAGFFGEQYGDSVADGVAEAADFGDEEALLEVELAARDGAAEEGEDFVVDGLLGRLIHRAQSIGRAGILTTDFPGASS